MSNLKRDRDSGRFYRRAAKRLRLDINENDERDAGPSREEGKLKVIV